VSAVNTRADFVAFVYALVQDLCEHPEQWENTTLEMYLEALAAWVEDAKHNLESRQLSWRRVGEMLLAARIYE
jgi:hypothetical protein